MELHIAFGYSQAGSIRQAVAGRDAHVVRFSDDLSYGPILSSDSMARRAWIEKNLGFDNPDISADEKQFWPAILARDATRIAWLSRRSPSDYCAFLEYLRRLDDLPTQVIETSFLPNGSRGTGGVPASELAALLNTAHELSEKFRTDYCVQWDTLRSQDSPLRVMVDGKSLVSAPIDFFDKKLLSLMTCEWKPMARVVGELLSVEVMADFVFFSRLYALADTGVLELRDSGKRHPDVRLAT